MPEYLIWEKWLKHLWRFALCVILHLKNTFSADKLFRLSPP